MIRPDAPFGKEQKHGNEKSVQAAVWKERFQEKQSKDNSGAIKTEQEIALALLGVALKTQDDPASEVAKLRKESETILSKSNPDYAKAAQLLKRELDLLKKLHPDGETADFIKPTGSLGHCLLALSKGKGSKEADEYFAKSLKLIDANPKTDEQGKREQEVYRFSILQAKASNNRQLAISATDPKQREAFNIKAEKEFTDALAALEKGSKADDFKKSPDRLKTLISLALVEDALGKKESFAKHKEEIKGHPDYGAAVQSRLDSGVVMNAVYKVSEKSPELRAIMKEMETECPWGPKMSVSVKHDSKATSYDPLRSQMVLGSEIPPEEKPQSYAFAATLGMKQGLSVLYGGDKPVDLETYMRVQTDRFVAAYQAKAKVAKEQGVAATIEDKDGKKHDLTKLTAKEIEDIVVPTNAFIVHCARGYAGLVENFDSNKRILTKAKLLKKGY
jgi:hypothetical protein